MRVPTWTAAGVPVAAAKRETQYEIVSHTQPTGGLAHPGRLFSRSRGRQSLANSTLGGNSQRTVLS